MILAILVLVILSDVVADNSIIELIIDRKSYKFNILPSIMLFIQVIAAPVQASISDYYCRKKSLIFSLIACSLSFLFLIFTQSSSSFALILLWIGVLLNGSLGNMAPIAWSALADIQGKNLRFSLGLTTLAYPIGYMFLGTIKQIETQNFSTIHWIWRDVVPPVLLLICSIGLIYKFYTDPKDKKALRPLNLMQITKLELIALYKELQLPSTRLGTLSYFFWALSQYNILIIFLESENYLLPLIFSMLGYPIGVFILGISRKTTDEKMIKSAYIITTSFLLLFFILETLISDTTNIISSVYFFYTIGNAFLTCSIFSLFSKERSFHKQGKGFGLIVSADSAGFLMAICSSSLFKYFNVDIYYIALFSLFVFLISWLPYSSYEKRREDFNHLLRKNVKHIRS